VRTTAMVVAILVGAFFLNIVLQAIGLTQQLSRLITAYELSPVQVLSAVIVLYLVLGTFMEELSMMISTIPITTPLVIQAGYDPVWYGILIVLLIQTAMISPPFGINLFVIHGIRGRGTLADVERGSAPFVIALLLMIAMICLWPEIAMWLPRLVG
jgi:TRAP-type C4-dicarboxylate transport system permease large subunit